MRIGIRTGLVALFILALVGTFQMAGAQETLSPDGHWDGAIQVPGQALGINVDLAVDAAGAWTGDISIPLQQTTDFPLGNIVVDGMKVEFQMEGVPGAPGFKGTLSEDGQTISGTFSQGGQNFPFSLTRG